MTIPTMAEDIHESAQRLFDIALELADAKGPAAVAELLNESPQVVTNWARRGISERGALKVQAAIGVDANWILTGQGVPYAGWPFPRVEALRYLRLDVEDRTWVQGRLQQAIEECESSRHRDASVLAKARGVLNTPRKLPARKVSGR